MIYFFYGEDDFRIKQRLNELKAGLQQADANLDVQIRPAAELRLADLQNLTVTQSLLTQSQLIVVQEPISAGSEELREDLLTWLDQPLPDEVTLVFTERQPDQRTKLFRRLNQFMAEAYPPLRAPEANRWLQQQAARRGVKIEAAAATLLTDSFSDDLWRMSQELDKLALFSAGRPIDKKMVDELVPRPLTDDIFATIEALARKNLASANQLINRQLILGMPEQQLLAMIAYQFRNLVLIKSWLDRGTKASDLAAKTQLHPYVVQKTTELARRFSLSELARIFYLLQRVDSAIKKGLTTPRVGLDILTAQVVSA